MDVDVGLQIIVLRGATLMQQCSMLTLKSSYSFDTLLDEPKR
jgi:hypothetical protein